MRIARRHSRLLRICSLFLLLRPILVSIDFGFFLQLNVRGEARRHNASKQNDADRRVHCTPKWGSPHAVSCHVADGIQ